MLALSAEGWQDRESAQRLTTEGFHAARRDTVPLRLVGKIRRMHQRPARRHQRREQAQVDGQWTVWGLSQRLRVKRSWVYHQIVAGRVPATRHPTTGS